MKALKTACFCLALLAPTTAGASDAPASPPSQFGRLWTGWSSINREAMTVETEAAQRVRDDLATADAARLAELRNQGRDLGERVGEIVREGDCEGGERMARDAGDFALVEAVRAHCRRTAAAR